MHANTERLGLGTALLAALDDRRAVWKMLEAALEHGITHFDTARLYGDGTMERTLSPFIKAHRNQITITSKFGLEGKWSGAMACFLLPKARGVVKKLVGHRRVISASPAAAHEPPMPRLDVEHMRTSLRTSLRELGTDHIDIFLMHEARAGQITVELLEALEKEKASGAIGAYGSGGEWANTMDLGKLPWPSVPILQAPASLALSASHSPSPAIVHSIFRGLGHLEKTITCGKFPLGHYPGGHFQPGVSLPELFLQWALAQFPVGKILFGARSIATLKTNAKIAATPIDSGLLAARLGWLQKFQNQSMEER